MAATTTITAPFPATEPRTANRKNNPAPAPSRPRRATPPLTLEQFRRRYANREDGHKYEFVKGKVIKWESNMNAKQTHIVKNISRRFTKTAAYQSGAELLSEIDQMTGPDQQRRPDMSFWPAEKIAASDEAISPFVIEIISPTDKIEDVEDKLQEYFLAGVQVVWQILPRMQSVKVYTSLTEVTICTGERICSAAPVLPDFQMSAADVFQKTAATTV